VGEKEVGASVVRLGFNKAAFSTGVAGAKKELQNFGRDTKSIAGDISGAWGAITGGAVALGVLHLLEASAESEKATVTLGQAMKQAGTYTKAALAHSNEYAASLMRLTNIDDEAIASVQEHLTHYGLQGEALDKLTAATLDLAVAQKIDLDSAAKLVGRTVASSTNALKRQGVQVDGLAGSIERATSAYEGIEVHFGGAAAAAIDTTSGKIEGLKIDFGELEEAVGALVSGEGVGFISWLDKVTRKATDAAGILDKLWNGESSTDIDAKIEETKARMGKEKAAGTPAQLLFYEQDKKYLARLMAQRDKFRATLPEERLTEGSDALIRRRGGLGGIYTEDDPEGDAERKRKAEAAQRKAAEAAKKYLDEQKKLWDPIFQQARDRRREDYSLDEETGYASWLEGEAERAADEARELRRMDDLMGQFYARKREDISLDEETGYASWLEEQEEASRYMIALSERTAEAMEQNFSDLFFDAMSGKLKSFEDYARAIFQSIQRAAADILGQMMKETLFGKAGDSGGGFIGSLFSDFGSLFGAGSEYGGSENAVIGEYGTTAFGMAGGGTITEPIFGVGRSGRRYKFGEGNRWEDVNPRGSSTGGIPASSGGDTYHVTIVAADAKSFADLADRNPQAIIAPFRKALRSGDKGLRADIRGVL